jgi:hypothetical protein
LLDSWASRNSRYTSGAGIKFRNVAGSVMIAADNTSRNFKGCELDPEYYNRSIERYIELTGKEFKQ